ncbi:8395_t:CDS:1, partial [Funneliformis geosporum]
MSDNNILFDNNRERIPDDSYDYNCKNIHYSDNCKNIPYHDNHDTPYNDSCENISYNDTSFNNQNTYTSSSR